MVFVERLDPKRVVALQRFSAGWSSAMRLSHPDRRIEFRIGINIGDVIAEGDDIFRDGVNIAARLKFLSPVRVNCGDPAVIREGSASPRNPPARAIVSSVPGAEISSWARALISISEVCDGCLMVGSIPHSLWICGRDLGLQHLVLNTLIANASTDRGHNWSSVDLPELAMDSPVQLINHILQFVNYTLRSV